MLQIARVLGLMYMKQVVQGKGGTIKVHWILQPLAMDWRFYGMSI